MKFKIALALLLLAPIGFALSLDLHVEPEENNACAGRLEGIWEFDDELSKRLGVRSTKTRLEFVVDDSFLPLIPAKFAEFLGKQPIFEAGRLTWREGDSPRTYPYVLTNHAGNPILVTFRERDAEPLGDAESCYLSVIPAKEHAKDLLFVGSDFDNEPYRPFRRVVEKKN